MTKQEQNEIIIRYIDKELRELPNIQTRVAKTFNTWFHSLIKMAAAASTPATEPPPEGEEGAPAPA